MRHDVQQHARFWLSPGVCAPKLLYGSVWMISAVAVIVDMGSFESQLLTKIEHDVKVVTFAVISAANTGLVGYYEDVIML
ncbi:hypothetical protein EOD43_14360 [Sphingomonas crocodyli]|uniref:Uncharacterized protein n=1 Tax=Sphingomonas crocodyli TaxID=1979270 RepID=A0A437MBD2_9SPHN|nr:hypothetical protein EOD43_14360 [Sphingomonas crocodyli]